MSVWVTSFVLSLPINEKTNLFTLILTSMCIKFFYISSVALVNCLYSWFVINHCHFTVFVYILCFLSKWVWKTDGTGGNLPDVKPMNQRRPRLHRRTPHNRRRPRLCRGWCHPHQSLFRPYRRPHLHRGQSDPHHSQTFRPQRTAVDHRQPDPYYSRTCQYRRRRQRLRQRTKTWRSGRRWYRPPSTLFQINFFFFVSVMVILFVEYFDSRV